MIIRRNAVRCNLCSCEIESTHRHDYKECTCGACSIDGDHEYLRRLCKSSDCFTELSVTELSVFDSAEAENEE